MFDQIVHTHRRRLGLTQEELAERAGIGVRTIRDIEAGRITRPRQATVRRLADVFDLCGAERNRFNELAAPGKTLQRAPSGVAASPRAMGSPPPRDPSQSLTQLRDTSMEKAAKDVEIPESHLPSPLTRSRPVDGSPTPCPLLGKATGVPVRILVADDQDLVRGGLTMILNAQPDLTVVAEAADGEQAVRAAQQLNPNVVLMDVRIPRIDGIEATRRICRASQARVLVLTTDDLDQYVHDALRAGASGFLLKDIRRDDLAAAVRLVAAGQVLLAPAVARRLTADLAHRRSRKPAMVSRQLALLSQQEEEMLRLVARGLSDAEIAAAHCVPEHTARTQVCNLLAGLGVRDRLQAVVLAYESGLITPCDEARPALPRHGQ